MQDFNKIASRLQKKEIKFIIEPTLRFKGEPGEQKTMFFYDPSFNAIEIKAFIDSKEIFRVSWLLYKYTVIYSVWIIQ